MGNTGSHKGGGRGSMEYQQQQQGSDKNVCQQVIGSPLTYSIQGSMEPPQRSSEASLTGTNEYVGWTAQPKTVPTVIVWNHQGEQFLSLGNHQGEQSVEIWGSWNSWSVPTPLQPNGKEFTIIKLLPPGVYQYKYKIDGEWRYDPNKPAVYDDDGNVNNTIEVHEFPFENINNLEGFEPPPSPRDSYCNPRPVAEDYLKEPPQMPHHLHLTLLNVPPAKDAQAVLPRPNHVVLNHVYQERNASNAIVIGSTKRYKSKYITTVMYKPRKTSAYIEQTQ